MGWCTHILLKMEGNHEKYQTLGTIEDAVEVVKEQK